MFHFRIINLPDGNQLIDERLKTPYDALTPLQLVEYEEMEKHIIILQRLEHKRRKETERKRKLARNPIYKIACICGIV